jgi:alkylation response protein AidB-like acyl-CoA dehydrogenase
LDVVSTLAETVRELAPRLAEREAADSERYPAENVADLVDAGVAAIRRELSTPAPASAAWRVRLSDAQMREESLRAYLHETARAWTPGAGPAYAALALRTKTYVTQEATRLCAELFALSGGRHYTRNGRLARTLAAAFAGTALRPPLPLALETLLQQFTAD